MNPLRGFQYNIHCAFRIAKNTGNPFIAFSLKIKNETAYQSFLILHGKYHPF
jgi:hypothetical protein